MNWLYYIAEANLYLGVFYLAYCLFLHKQTHYQLNRAYLLAACVLSFIIPVVQLGFLMPVQAVIIGRSPIVIVADDSLTWLDFILYVYIIGVVVGTARFALKLYQLKSLVNNNPTTPYANYTVVTLPESNTAFSFFSYLFMSQEADDETLITRHEMVHIRQKHSVDIVFTEVLKIACWFNPLIYLLQNSLKTVHEYIADEQTAVNETDTISYATYLVNNAYGISGPAITHSFFNYNLLKKRITMLHQKRSGNLARLKYLIAAPLCMGLLYQSTFGFDKTYALVSIAPKAPVIVQTVASDTIPAKPRQIITRDIKPKARVEQVVVADKKGDLVDIRTNKGKTIHQENLEKQKAQSNETPAEEPKVSGFVVVDRTGEVITDALYREGKVKGINIQNVRSGNSFGGSANRSISRVTATQKDLDADEPTTITEIQVQEPAQQTLPPKKDKTVKVNPAAPKPDVSKVKFPPPPPPQPPLESKKLPNKKVTQTQKRLPPPPPAPPIEKKKVSKIKN